MQQSIHMTHARALHPLQLERVSHPQQCDRDVHEHIGDPDPDRHPRAPVEPPHPASRLTMRSPLLPSPNGFGHPRGLTAIARAHSTMRSGSAPASTFAPTLTDSGRSVLSRSVTHGTWSTHASSWSP